MASDKLRFFGKFFPVVVKFALSLLVERIQAFAHRFTYKSVPSSQNVVVVGGSFAGALLAKRLAESLPTGYKVILIEKNSHFNYTFNFPRYSVIRDREAQAFIPYGGLMKNVPDGIFEQIRDLVTGITEGEVQLVSGSSIPFAFLAIATGVTQTPPAKLLASEKIEACAELRILQAKIREAKKIAIVGAGAVGVQMAGDIKSFYPEKAVVLIHSRQQLLPSFGSRLHEYVMEKLNGIGVDIRLGERPLLPSTPDWEAVELTFRDGTSEHFDLVVKSPSHEHECDSTDHPLRFHAQDKHRTPPSLNSFARQRYPPRPAEYLSSPHSRFKTIQSRRHNSKTCSP
jgi:NADPH-dependent 2,4-dienoyl-CoA reductase/sulfur reductase-like enzyme